MVKFSSWWIYFRFYFYFVQNGGMFLLDFLLFNSLPACLRRGLSPNERAAALHLPGLPSPGCPLCRLRRHSPCAPDPGNFLYAQKATKKAPGDPDPFFLQSDAPKIGYQVATEIPLACWPLVIGAEVYPLRLTALGLRDFAVFLLSKITCFPKKQAIRRRKKIHLSL